MYLNMLLVIALGITISLFEVPRLLQRKMKGELAAFCGFLLVGMALAAALALRLPVPNPTSGVEFIFSPVTRLLFPR